jgi:phosphoserine phosphatase RsbU/P
MDQHKLFRTLKLLSETTVRTDEELLGFVLESIIRSQEIPINGGRIWKLEGASGTYRLVGQHGDMERIRKNFRIRVREYPLLLHLHRKGTVVGKETNEYLRSKGIKTYTATGVGERIAWKGYQLFQYIIGINGELIGKDLTYALNIIGSALTTALKKRRIETKARALEADLDKAREIQRSILPEHEQKFFHYDLYGISIPDRVVGGDFFDYLQASGDRERLGVVIGDAASKGLSAAAQALYVSGALRMAIEYQTQIGSLLTRLNFLVNTTFSAEHFISLVYAELQNSDKGLVLYVNAGHSNPLILRHATGAIEKLQATGQILGPFPGEEYRSDFTTMEKGDIMLLYTDGIVEASNEQGEMYGEQKLMQALRTHRSRTPREICQVILEEVQVFNQGTGYSDDKTLVVIKKSRGSTGEH